MDRINVLFALHVDRKTDSIAELVCQFEREERLVSDAVQRAAADLDDVGVDGWILSCAPPRKKVTFVWSDRVQLRRRGGASSPMMSRVLLRR